MKNRLDAVRTYINEKKLDGLFISNFYNILYLTGFKTLTENEREAFVLVTRNSVYVFTDSRYECDSEKVVVKMMEPGKGLTYFLKQIAHEEQLHTMGFESENLTYLEFLAITKNLPEIVFIPTQRAVMQIREVKDADEVDAVAAACAEGDKILEETIPLIRSGMTEQEIGYKIESAIRSKGNGLAFDPIVAIDKHSALPHFDSRNGRGTVKKGSVILIDFGVKKNDYLSDITRMFFFGKPSSEIEHVYEVLKTSQKKTLLHCAKTEKLSEVDLYCRQLLKEHSLPNYPHSTGHGVGLEIHEYPKVSMGAEDKKKERQIITIEPGVYYPEKYGMRVEDTVVIQNGKAIVLTKYPKDLRILS